MNKLCRKVAQREGFTLVELIVVIAILGILAGIAIPVYSGYISKAQEANDLQAMDSIKTAIVFTLTEDAVKAGTDTPVVKAIEVTSTAIKYGIGDEANTPLSAEQLKAVAALTKYQEGENFKYTFVAKDKDTATWNGTTWTLTKAAG